AWTDLTYLLHKDNVSWGYYIAPGTQPDCDDNAVACTPQPQSWEYEKAQTPEIWNPLPDFLTVHQDQQVGNVQPSSNFFRQARAGKLPSVSWVVPNGRYSDHPPALVSAGHE